MHTLADSHCLSCAFEFYHTLPIGHDQIFPMKIAKDGTQAYFSQRAKDWLAQPLIKAIKNKGNRDFLIEKIGNTSAKEVIIVNCLDTCFGHVFSKTWNTYALIDKYKDKSIIAIIPKHCTWLLPPSISETWVVDANLSEMNQWIAGLDSFIKQQFPRFESIKLSHTPTHLDNSKYINMEKVLKTKRFDLNQFDEITPQITFVLREDRFWLNSKAYNLLFMFARKYNLQSWINPWLLIRQSLLLRQAARKILKALPNAKLIVVGLGNKGSIPNDFSDHRVAQINNNTEILWNSIYANSHLVIGVHGSHMLIPSALAAGFINIVPRYKIEHIVEDTVLPYQNRLLHFLGRFLDESTDPALLSSHAISMIRDFEYVYKNLNQKIE